MPKLMLIEDDQTMLSLLKTLLEMEGFQVAVLDSLHDSKMIIGKILDALPDLLLIDVHLHQINGLEILKEIRSSSTLKSVIVLMSSGMELGEQCKKAGADGFILKPYMPDELIQYIHRALSSSSAQSQGMD